jgi:DNA-binding response OmpR family regulator
MAWDVQPAVIISTAFSSYDFRCEIKRLGASAYFLKPYCLDALKKEIRLLSN